LRASAKTTPPSQSSKRYPINTGKYSMPRLKTARVTTPEARDAMEIPHGAITPSHG
jgi:hypothetical protein